MRSIRSAVTVVPTVACLLAAGCISQDPLVNSIATGVAGSVANLIAAVFQLILQSLAT